MFLKQILSKKIVILTALLVLTLVIGTQVLGTENKKNKAEKAPNRTTAPTLGNEVKISGDSAKKKEPRTPTVTPIKQNPTNSPSNTPTPSNNSNNTNNPTPTSRPETNTSNATPTPTARITSTPTPTVATSVTATPTLTSIPTSVPTLAPTAVPTPLPTTAPASQPDLIITGMNIPNVKVATWNYFEVTIKNQGSAKYYSLSNIYISITGSRGTTSCEIGLPSLDPGTSYTLGPSCITYSPGTNAVTAKVDYNNNISEGNEDNNQYQANFYAQP